MGSHRLQTMAMLIPTNEHGLWLIAVTRGLEAVALVLLAHGAAIRFWHCAFYCAAIAAGVLVMLDLPSPANHSAERYWVLWTLYGVGIAVVVMLLAGLLAKRAPTRPPTPAGQPNVDGSTAHRLDPLTRSRPARGERTHIHDRPERPMRTRRQQGMPGQCAGDAALFVTPRRVSSACTAERAAPVLEPACGPASHRKEVTRSSWSLWKAHDYLRPSGCLHPQPGTGPVCMPGARAVMADESDVRLV